jgi:hypothetical protein
MKPLHLAIAGAILLVISVLFGLLGMIWLSLGLLFLLVGLALYLFQKYYSSLLLKHVAAALLVGVAVLTLNLVVGELLGVYADGMMTGRDVFPWLPRGRTPGETVVTYQLVVSMITYLVAPAVIFVIGYHLGVMQTSGISER